MYGVLMALRTIIGSGVAFVVWWVIATALGSPQTFVGTLAPVWLAGLVGGVVCALFDPRQGVQVGFAAGVLLTLGFLFVRHGLAGVPLSGNTLVTLWPVWFLPSFYVGAYGYVLLRVRSGS